MTVREPPPPDYYRELEVVPTAAAETIRAAYTALAKRHHPDVNPSRAAAERMQRLNEAYAVLGNDTKRKAYDAVRAQQPDVVPASFGLFMQSPPPDGAGPPTATTPRTEQRRYALCAAGGLAAALLLLVLIVAVRGLGDGQARAATVPTPASKIVRRQVSSGATPPPTATPITAGAPSPATPRGADVIAAAAAFPGFPQIDALRDASHGVTGADRGWRFQLLGCSVFVGEYRDVDATRAAVDYWRDSLHADEIDTGDLVIGVSGCPDPSAAGTVDAGLRAIVATPPAPRTSP